MQPQLTPQPQRKMFKVISPVEKRNATTNSTAYWMRVGTGYTNRDGSVNIYLDAIPKTFQLQLRELDEDDLRKRESSSSGELGFAVDRTAHADRGYRPSAAASMSTASALTASSSRSPLSSSSLSLSSSSSSNDASPDDDIPF